MNLKSLMIIILKTMTITISLFWIVLLIVVVHTILQHLINWMWRGVDNADDSFVPFILSSGEAIILIAILYRILS